MRRKRIRIDHENTWYHCYNRIAGEEGELPFGDGEKQKIIQLVKRLCGLYTVRVVALQTMGNHFHILLQAPNQPPTPEEVCQRYNRYYKDRKITPDSEECAIWQGRCRDISWFMRHFQQNFSIWYNNSRSVPRRGPVWASRFKSTILESGKAVWQCLQYIENNPARAGICKDPATYLFGTHGIWHGSGKHMFEYNIRTYLLPMLEGLFGPITLAKLQRMLDQALADKTGRSPTDTSLFATLDRRMRFWTHGVVIGSKEFIRQTMQDHRQSRIIESRIKKMDDASLAAWFVPA